MELRKPADGLSAVDREPCDDVVQCRQPQDSEADSSDDVDEVYLGADDGCLLLGAEQ
jgi:hypothetical protein